MDWVTKRLMEDCPLHMVKSIKALNLKDFRTQVNYYVLLLIHHLSVYPLKRPIIFSHHVSKNIETYIQEREIEYLGIIS